MAGIQTQDLWVGCPEHLPLPALKLHHHRRMCTVHILLGWQISQFNINLRTRLGKDYKSHHMTRHELKFFTRQVSMTALIEKTFPPI